MHLNCFCALNLWLAVQGVVPAGDVHQGQQQIPSAGHADSMAFLTGKELGGSCPRVKETSVFPPHRIQVHQGNSKAETRKLCLYTLQIGHASDKLHSSGEGKSFHPAQKHNYY